MAKFRRNHTNVSKESGGMITKVGLFGAIVAGLYFLFNFFANADFSENLQTEEGHKPSKYVGEAHFLPAALPHSTIYHYKRYSLSYNERYEQADWVAYVLEGENLRKPWAERSDNFRPDPSISSKSATPDDYRGSGYDRGHMVPAADMAYDAEAMDETFLMSNISPQARNFNQGVWRELEELTRDWAKKYKRLYVVSGPVLSEKPKAYIGRDNKVAVPTAYFKVLLDLDEPEQKAIAFLLPNEVSYKPLFEFATSIDEVEAVTGIDFFADFMPESLEVELESNFNTDLWYFSKQKYDIRVNKWNK
ncbi:MAG: DNA/RNA non-specific endonuclease [Bacteroidetes bacterium]|nr:MAG: DNA/RNA non-specific endonuclease [Bacteroidota bacterium]